MVADGGWCREVSAPFVILLNDDGTYVLYVQPDVADLMQLAAKAVVFWGRKAIERRGIFHLALSGGNTPRPLYELLATEAYARQIPWDRVHLWWGDERAVAANHVESNYRMARQALIERVPIPQGNVHRVRAELGPEQAATHYETEIQFAFGLMQIDDDGEAILVRAEGRPRFDLILLGLGNDGHSASLFPGTEALGVIDRLVVANVVPRLRADRITFTYPLINAADCVIVLATGPGKADVLRDVLLGEYRPDVLPAQGIRPAGKLFWMCDAAAAARVATGPDYPAGEVIYRRT
jgi:6-phosphogluconolactonase